MNSDLSKLFWRRSNGQALGSKLVSAPSMKALNTAEVAEVMSLLTPLTNKSMLELGAGVGRFTEKLGSQAAEIDALDICAEAIHANQKRNQHLTNITYHVVDITEHTFEKAKYDVVFANWLLMYLSKDDVLSLLEKLVHSLKPGGVILFRESCEKNYKGIAMWRHILSKEFVKDIWPWTRYSIYNIWKMKLNSWREFFSLAYAGTNLVVYRKASLYESWFSERFDVVSSGYIKAYFEKYGNDQQRYWLLKVRS